MPTPFEISPGDDGTTVATDGIVVATLRGDGRVFRRRGIQVRQDGHNVQCEMAVAELDGVRAYITQADGQVHVIVTQEDLWP